MNELNYSDGSFYERNGKLYVQGAINGKRFKKSLKKDATSTNKKWLSKKNPIDVLLEILGIEKDNTIDTISFELFGLKYLNATSINRLEDSQDDYLRIFNNTILPVFKDYKWDEIDSFDILEFFKNIYSNYCYDRCKRTKNILRNIITSAHDKEFMKKNPFNTEELKKHIFPVKAKNTTAYTAAEAKLMLNHSEGWFKVLLEIALKYGLRIGELMGLKWSDFDLERGVFKIQRNITKAVIRESIEMKTPNKNHLRDIYLFPETIVLLKKYANFKPNDTWLFVNKDGKPFTQSKSISDNHLRPLLKSIGVEYKAFHATRRCYASIMQQSEDVKLEDIQEVMGHKKGSAITEKHYMGFHVISDTYKQKKALEKSNIYNAILDLEN